MHENGTLVIHKLTKGKDDGRYGCTAEDRQGRSDTKSIDITVMGK